MFNTNEKGGVLFINEFSLLEVRETEKVMQDSFSFLCMLFVSHSAHHEFACARYSAAPGKQLKAITKCKSN